MKIFTKLTLVSALFSLALIGCEEDPTSPNDKPIVKTNPLIGEWAELVDTLLYDSEMVEIVKQRCGVDWIWERPCLPYSDVYNDSMTWTVYGEEREIANRVFYKVVGDTIFKWPIKCDNCTKSDTNFIRFEIHNDTNGHRNPVTGLFETYAFVKVK